ncbi:MAG: ATP-binding protein [Treponema sp.]|nr:MAG: ATP-binding protein [Treponema sp.]
MQIIPIASGKGGVGKSLLAANLAIALSQAGKKTVLVDLDLGASNLHLVLGVAGAKKGVGTFLTGDSDFSQIIFPTEYENLSFIPGDSEIPGFAALKIYERNKLVKNLQSIDADYLIMDLGAGTHLGILDFFLLSPQGIIITSPTVTATLDAYLFLKNVAFRMIFSTFARKSKGGEYLEKLKKDGESMQRMYIPKILESLKTLDPKGVAKLLDKMSKFKPRVVMNMIDDPREAEKVMKIRRSCKQYLNIDLEHLGVIYRDNVQDVALSSRLPVIIYKPESLVSQAIYRIADKIIESQTVEFETTEEFEEFSDDSFYVAGEEATIDYKNKLAYIEDLVGSGALAVGDLTEIIKSQHFEITTLRKENLLLKTKIKRALEQGFKI